MSCDDSATPSTLGRAESRARLWPSSRQDQNLPTDRSVRVEILFCRNFSLRSRLAFRRGIRRHGGCSVEASLASLCRLVHFHECHNRMRSIGERPIFRCKEMN
ncbi:hypothetical protein TNCV_1939191 [Trichonephila clavipes]|nr:hypothetical protein TNCV_1939191 [Trichonephila clavipes]